MFQITYSPATLDEITIVSFAPLCILLASSMLAWIIGFEKWHRLSCFVCSTVALLRPIPLGKWT